MAINMRFKKIIIIIASLLLVMVGMYFFFWRNLVGDEASSKAAETESIDAVSSANTSDVSSDVNLGAATGSQTTDASTVETYTFRGEVLKDLGDGIFEIKVIQDELHNLNVATVRVNRRNCTLNTQYGINFLILTKAVSSSAIHECESSRAYSVGGDQ